MVASVHPLPLIGVCGGHACEQPDTTPKSSKSRTVPHTLRYEPAVSLCRESIYLVTYTITPQIEAALEALDRGERAVTGVVSPSFVLQLMHGLGLPIGAEYAYHPEVFEAQCSRKRV